MKKLIYLLFIASLLLPFTPALSSDSGLLIKGQSFTSVYYLSTDGKRYAFPNDRVYATWYLDFSGVVEVSDEALASYQLGGNVTYRPGAKLVKIQTDPKTYAVDRGGVLRWVTSEAVAQALYGLDWNTKVDDIPDVFFFNYEIGEPIYSVTDFSPATALATVTSISENRRPETVATATQEVGGSPLPVAIVYPEPTRPSITYFRTDKPRGALGDSVTLEWSANNATTCILTQIPDTRVPFTGNLPTSSTTVTLNENVNLKAPVFTYYLTCADHEWYTDTAQVSINIVPDDTQIDDPYSSQSCTLDVWSCSGWTPSCSKTSSNQTRTCWIVEDCPGVSTPSPAIFQECPNVIYTPEPVIIAMPSKDSYIVKDDFEDYDCGVVAGSNGWSGFQNWESIIISDGENGKSIFAQSTTDSVIFKSGEIVADGRQSLYVWPVNSGSWSTYNDGNIQFRLTSAGWGDAFMAMTLKNDGIVTYHRNGGYVDFARFRDGEWNLLEMEWSLTDGLMRYGVNGDVWTSWMPTPTGWTPARPIRTLGIDIVHTGTEGGVYIDAIH